jgi:hypothetical protein
MLWIGKQQEIGRFALRENTAKNCLQYRIWPGIAAAAFLVKFTAVGKQRNHLLLVLGQARCPLNETE